MEVTISIINYNYGQYLIEAIESALNQTTNAVYEVLVIDDGSTDNSDEIIATYQSNAKFRSSKTENRGFAAALSRALTEARGEYVFFMDSDDHFLTNKLEFILPIMKKNNFFFVADSPKPFDLMGTIYKHNNAAGCTSTVVVNRKKALLLCPVENEIWYNSLYQLGLGIYLNETYTNYRMHNSSMTNRSIPGKQNAYLSNITHNLSNQLARESTNIAKGLGVPISKVIKVSNFYKSQAYYNEVEMHLELASRLIAFKSFIKMFYFGIISKNKIQLFDLKMLLKIIVLKPSNKFRI
ncbi:glycosyltransferase family 2 protein [Flavobacterium sp. RSP29]|uniref:glycosyltransferase family 2 protein n=1 Tax=Flavobacterium sp. RSP29 TaxID=3401731 RepID=UPI003AAFA955